MENRNDAAERLLRTVADGKRRHAEFDASQHVFMISQALDQWLPKRNNPRMPSRAVPNS